MTAFSNVPPSRRMDDYWPYLAQTGQSDCGTLVALLLPLLLMMVIVTVGLPMSHQARFRCLRLPNGQVLAVVLEDGSVRLWTPATRKLIASLPPPADYDSLDDHCNLAFSADSNLLAIYSQSFVRVWDVGTNKIGATLYHDSTHCRGQLIAAVLQLDTVIVVDCIRNLHHTVHKSNSDKNNTIHNIGTYSYLARQAVSCYGR
jgi:WD40 repeat protein